MAEGEDDGPTLRLIIEKGPSEGRIHDFNPRSRSEVKIGRIVRGNTLSIKDEGISSKHASIRFESHLDRPVRCWVISDLDSSNGTVLNERVLEPFTPVALSDGDVIKIGGSTSIVVRLEVVRVGVEEGNVRRRIPRRKGRHLEMIDLTNESPLGKEDESKGNFRVTRSAASKANGVQIELLEAENLGRRAGSRRNGRKKEENGVPDAEEMVSLTQDEVQERPSCTENEDGGKGKGTKRNTKKDHALEISSGNELQNSDAVEMLLPTEKKGGQNLSLRRSARNLRKERNMESLEENGEDKPQSRRGIRGRRKNLGMETLTENDDEAAEKSNSEVEVLEGMKEGLREESEGIHGLVEEEGLKLAAEGSQAMASTSGLVKENDDIEVDLEKMTLGEWFDFLDVYLPKQIIYETEKMILDMRQKSEKFHCFMLQQQQQQNNKNSNSKVEELG